MFYYDELIDHKNYQLSYFMHANEDYYNCAHAVSSISKKDLKTIEEFYEKRNLVPAFYVDQFSEKELIPKLIKHGYKETLSQQENWWVMDLTANKIKNLQKQSFLKCDASTINLNLVSSKKQLEEFIEIDRKTNLLPDPIATALKKNILSKKYNGAQSHYLLGTVDNIPAFSGYVGIYNKVAYFAEDGTLENYRGMGLHSYITQNRLLFSFAKGAKLACITCSTEAHTNKTAKKLGFTLYFSRKLFKKE